MGKVVGEEAEVGKGEEVEEVGKGEIMMVEGGVVGGGGSNRLGIKEE